VAGEQVMRVTQALRLLVVFMHLVVILHLILLAEMAGEDFILLGLLVEMVDHQLLAPTVVVEEVEVLVDLMVQEQLVNQPQLMFKVMVAQQIMEQLLVVQVVV
jgi:hypothetical protein